MSLGSFFGPRSVLSLVRSVSGQGCCTREDTGCSSCSRGRWGGGLRGWVLPLVAVSAPDATQMTAGGLALCFPLPEIILAWLFSQV